ncbi:RNA polymerase sigma factor [Streptomyces sp. SCSIO ZS0520]|uniref:RNA polymerase sigma factor n=1 Tax=Streptomyces sp. SCSIO ZS0520 TaxID=2892996 RepID=UPI0021D97BF1|nr:RNA polymerase sigma factor [Streptomyces sp. SCSIO ZS0520]
MPRSDPGGGPKTSTPPRPDHPPGPRPPDDRLATKPATAEGSSPGPPATEASRASFDEVFCSLLDRLYRRAAMLAGTPHAAEDAVHEVYLKIAPRPQKFLAHPEPYAYAFATLLSVLRSGWRRERRQTPVADIPESANWSWDGGVEQRTAELEAVRLLGQLSVRQAAVVILVDLDGYTIDRAAEILSVHRGTVARTRGRALRKLKGSLSDLQREGRGHDES